MSVFDGFSEREARQIREAGTEVTIPQGWSPISEATPADKAYIVLEGEVSVRSHGQEIARVGPGEMIGEAAIMNHQLRSASIIAVTKLRLLHFTAEAINELCEELPAFRDALQETQAARAAKHAAEEQG